MLYKHLSRKSLQHDRSEQQTIKDIKEQFFSGKWFHILIIKKKKQTKNALSHFTVIFYFLFFPWEPTSKKYYACVFSLSSHSLSSCSRSGCYHSCSSTIRTSSAHQWHFCNLRTAQVWPKEDFLYNMAATGVTNAVLGWSTLAHSRESIQHGKHFNQILRDEDRPIGLTEWTLK